MTTFADPAAALGEYLCTKTDFDPPHDVLDLRHQDTHLCVGSWSDGYSLWWTDYVANDWIEWYPVLSVALARAAALMHCGEHDWAIGFTAVSFPDSAAQFFKEVTR